MKRLLRSFFLVLIAAALLAGCQIDTEPLCRYVTQIDSTCSYDGTPMNIGFSASFLIDILNNLPGREVVIELADPSRAGVMIPAEQVGQQELLMLLMPMMLTD